MDLSSHIIALLLRQCVGHAEYSILDEDSVSISKAEWMDLLSAGCWYTSSRQHNPEEQNILHP